MPQRGDIPVPVPNALSQPYWNHCARGELAFQRCGRCGRATHTPAYVCSNCLSPDLTWEVSSGAGAIYSYTTVWRPQSPEFEVPYVPAIIDVAEGWQMLSSIIGCAVDAVAVGLPVQVEFQPLPGGMLLPYFRTG